jgi:hypothetical protein
VAARTSINLDSDVYKDGVKRAKALKYKSFSQYVQHLIAQDVEKRPAHVTVREEAGQYPKKEKPRGSSAA